MSIDTNTPDIIDIKLATNLYFVIQEAVKNACIHGNANTVKVIFKNEQTNLKLVIKDDGSGLTPSDTEDNGRGLRIMSHRMELLGGTFDASEYSEAGESGTKITCQVPLSPLNNGQNVVTW